MIDLADRLALVTGAGRGLGFAYAQALAERGATVIVQDSGADSDGNGNDPDVAEAAVRRMLPCGRAFASSAPIATREDCAALIDGIVAEHGRLDVLIHNAGFVGYRAIEELDPAFLDAILRLSIDSSLWLAQAAWPTMKSRRFGRIILTTSDRAIYPQYAQEGLAAYAAAKLATVGIVNTLALEGRDHGILVNAISPVARTRMWGEPEREFDDMRPGAVAPGVVYLASPDCAASGWVVRAANGQFVATRAREADGVDYSRDLVAVAAETPEAVAAGWHRIAVDRPEARVRPDDTVAVALPSMAVLGECPVWSESRRRLLWVDTEARTLNRFDPATGRNEAFGMPDVIGMIAERKDGSIVAAIGCDLALIDDDGTVERFTTAPHGRSDARLNDGRLDDRGRLWIGLMEKALTPESGILFRYDPDGRWHVMDQGFTLINGLDWSPNRRTLYVTDSRAPMIYAYDYDPESGAVGPRRAFVRFEDGEGFPDGLVVDREGSLWSTLFNGSAIQRFDRHGNRTQRIALPVPRPTSCAFAGDGQALYVTTARLGLDAEQLDEAPLSGALFRVKLS